ncbi:MAG: 3-deoxy-D-manno-octulosonic acid transferase [Bacteroidetes bacterium]|nr:3-deoxy-D-manno-octulosonic acid transferase [Bacteroidota bacterium]
MIVLLYRIFNGIYYLGAKLASGWNQKAALWVEGRKETWEKIAGADIRGCVWFHVSSLGEFEQARPLIEKIKQHHPNQKIAVSFFSPSGYEIRKNFPLVDLVFYLPIDTKANAERMIKLLQPKKVIWVKYDFWYFMLREIHENNIPNILICGNFRKDQLFFKWYGRFYRNMLTYFTRIFVQNAVSVELLNGIGIPAHIAFDTRFDRVEAGRVQFKKNEFIDEFIGNHMMIVFGSTWTEDDVIISKAIDHLDKQFPNLKYIVAPHDIHSARIEETLDIYKNALKYSTKDQFLEQRILIIDNIGMLSSLYAQASIAYVGGGFGKSVHNVLEPAVYGIPVIFGPNYFKSMEAIELVELKGCFTIQTAEALTEKISNLLTSPEALSKSSIINRKYIEERLGGTEIILQYVESI